MQYLERRRESYYINKGFKNSQAKQISNQECHSTFTIHKKNLIRCTFNEMQFIFWMQEVLVINHTCSQGDLGEWFTPLAWGVWGFRGESPQFFFFFGGIFWKFSIFSFCFGLNAMKLIYQSKHECLKIIKKHDGQAEI